MFRLVTLFAAVALVVADPTVISPPTYRAGVTPYSAGILPYSADILPYRAGFFPYRADILPYRAGTLPYSAGVIPYNNISPYSYPYYRTVPAVRTAAIATQAPNTPAIELDPIRKVPLDTPEVALARISHLNAKALETVGIHTVKKRSIVSPLAYTAYPRVYSPDWISPYSAYRTPLYASSLGYVRGYDTINFHPY